MELGLREALGLGGLGVQREEIAQRRAMQTEQLTSQERMAEQQRRLQLAEITGSYSQTNPDGTVTNIPTLTAQRLGQERASQLLQQAQQMAQQTGFAYEVTADGTVQQLKINGEPVRTESSLARLDQKTLQEAELRGYFEVPGRNPNDPPTKISTVAAQQLEAQKLRDAAARAEVLSQQTGYVYDVDNSGTPVQRIGADGRPMTTEQARAQRVAEEQAKLDRQLREQLGMSEIAGVIYTRDANGNLTPSSNQTVARQQLNQARAEAMTQATGTVYQVNQTTGAVEQVMQNGQPVRTAGVTQADLDRELRRTLGLAELTGTIGTGTGAQTTLAAQQQLFAQRQAQQQMLVQLASALAQSTNIPRDQLNSLMTQLTRTLLNPTQQQQQQQQEGPAVGSQEFIDLMNRLSQQFSGQP